MALYAAVMTGKGTGAIATIQVFGDDAQGVLAGIFKPRGPKPAQFETGKVLLGWIVDGERRIDQVTIGCEGPQTFAIHCHGNPLIVEMIMELLGCRGTELVGGEELLRRILTAKGSLNTIAIEAKLAQLGAKTLAGTKIIANQIESGLSKWLEDAKRMPPAQVRLEAEEILNNSRAARLIIGGCTAVLTGPPNSGKSTLLNRLAGREKAIVSEVEGTTRDWVSSECQIGPLCVTLIDTAGLDEKLKADPERTVEKAAQEATARILTQAELIVLILDNSRTAEQLNEALLDNIAGKRVITALNKIDLPAKLDVARLPDSLSSVVQISAKFGAGIETLKKEILQIAGVGEINTKTTVAFTARHQDLLSRLTAAKSNRQARSIISELLNGRTQRDLSTLNLNG